MDADRGIALQGTIPWRLSKDLAHFKQLTTNVPDDEVGWRNAVIMGRKTWDSLPARHRPLFERINIVLTRSPVWHGDGFGIVGPETSLSRALVMAVKVHAVRIFVIGGGEVYAEAIKHPDCRAVYCTRLTKAFDCDTFMPHFEDDFQMQSVETAVENGIGFTFEHWTR